jgi:hypothetical protein
MYLKTEVKYLAFKENIIFLASSILSVWVWTLLCMSLDRGNDRGLLTIFGFIILTSILLSYFLSKKKLANSLKLILQFIFACILTIILTWVIGPELGYLIGIDWVGFILPVFFLGFSFYIILRQLFAFPNNKLAFWVIVATPAFTIFGLSVFYNSPSAHDAGVGFPVGVFLTIVFLAIGILCREKRKASINA